MLNELMELQTEQTTLVDCSFKRYLYPQIDWRSRLLAVTGARGVGKTTLLLQYYKEHFSSPEECLYISADHIRVAALGLFTIAGEFFKLGGKLLIIDEIHKYPDWSKELKNIYDSFPKGRVAISGSSSLELLKGTHDLSRRMVVYKLRGLSFREFLELETATHYEALTLAEVLAHHTTIATRIKGTIRVLKYFRDYMRHGCYPFYREGIQHYDIRLNNVVEKVLCEDIPAIFNIRASSVPYLKKLVYLIATSPPFIPNVEKISAQLGVSKEYIYHYLDYLDKAGIFASLFSTGQGFKLVRKAQKIYLENPNLYHAALGEMGFRAEVGALRESFFLGQLQQGHKVFASKQGDFIVDEKFIFEIGGKGKDSAQIRNAKNAYVVADDIEVGVRNKIPLWLFGFLY